MVQSRHSQDLSISSPVFPGGSILSAVFDRAVMRLSDRGGASGMIGDRWSDLTSAALDEWPGTTISTPDGEDVTISRVVRLDDIPAVARMASKRKLQNPDFVIVGTSDTREVVFSADAKFSVETASSSQVSAEALQSLLDLGEIFTTHLGDVDHRAEPVDGMFMSPEYSLTHYMMRSEEHTSELQSRENLVCRLMLE